GPAGGVLGIDGDAVKIAAAREAGAGLANLAFEVGDLTDPDGGAAFDVVYARFLLSHLTDPDRVVASLGGRIRSGDALIVEDVDFDGHFVDPPQPAFDRYVRWYQEAAGRRGANPRLGRELPRRIVAAGFDILHAGAVSPAALDGPVKQIAPLTLAAIAEPVVAAGLASTGEVERTLAELQAAADDPGVFMSLPRVVQVIARRI
ncbi:MAG TPA: methyltransferase domain-containing protein, partial [Caulobacter sp.]|nr:methyltransferase domain-containing protein [Caulobacter sp.]